MGKVISLEEFKRHKARDPQVKLYGRVLAEDKTKSTRDSAIIYRFSDFGVWLALRQKFIAANPPESKKIFRIAGLQGWDIWNVGDAGFIINRIFGSMRITFTLPHEQNHTLFFVVAKTGKREVVEFEVNLQAKGDEFVYNKASEMLFKHYGVKLPVMQVVIFDIRKFTETFGKTTCMTFPSEF